MHAQTTSVRLRRPMRIVRLTYDRLLSQRTQDMAKEILALKWKITFFEDRLRKTMPETSQALMEEIASLRHHYELLKTASKKNKKFALESQVVIEELKKEIHALQRAADASGGSSRELKSERQRAKDLEDELVRERARADKAERDLKDGDGKRRRETDHSEVSVCPGDAIPPGARTSKADDPSLDPNFSRPSSPAYGPQTRSSSLRRTGSLANWTTPRLSSRTTTRRSPSSRTNSTAATRQTSPSSNKAPTRTSARFKHASTSSSQ